MSEAVIYHLDHSGVVVEIEGKLLIFDYFNDNPAKGETRLITTGVLSENDLKRAKAVYVFVSHSHRDHFNPVIFNWIAYNSDIKYILSSDLPEPGLEEDEGEMKRKPLEYYLLERYQKISIEDLEITAYGTTDLGISFLVEVAGLKIFHAGDLNWWHWKSFTRAELKAEEEGFKGEIERLKGEKIDIAFIPVDPRLGEYYYLAGEYFAREIKPGLLVPIHFADQFEITSKFREKIADLPVEAARIEARGTVINYNREEARN